MTHFSKDERILRGMAAQLRLRTERLESGEEPAGWKVGFGSPDALRNLSLEGPLLGYLNASALLPSGAELSMADYPHLILEPEIAIHMGADLPGGGTLDDAREAIGALGPAIEVANLDFAPEGVERILTGNIYQRNVVLGEPDTSRARAWLEGMSARIFRDGEPFAEADDLQANTGNLIGTVRHVADVLAHFGEKLRAGEFIIAGSVVPPIGVDDPALYEYALAPFETISVQVTS